MHKMKRIFGLIIDMDTNGSVNPICRLNLCLKLNKKGEFGIILLSLINALI